MSADCAEFNDDGPRKRGWCPGALRPMASGDGLIVRIRPRGGALSATVLREIARLAEAHGNGLIDLTRRANLQLRGVSAATLPMLQQGLDELGVLDANPAAEAVRNVLVTPFADAQARAVALAIETGLVTDPVLWRLPTKFLIAVDAGAPVRLAAERADFRVWVNGDQAAIGVDRGSVLWLGATSRQDASSAVLDLARAVLALGGGRTRDLSATQVDGLHRAFRQLGTNAWMGPGLCRDDDKTPANQAAPPLGHIGNLIGLAAAFGSIHAAQMIALTTCLPSDVTIRLAPWRALYVPAPAQDEAAASLVTRAVTAGWIADAKDPLLRIEACTGAPGCASTRLDTRRLARAMAPRLAELQVQHLHVSGCTKGCACSRPMDLVLSAAGDRWSVVRRGRADGTPLRSLAARDIDAAPAEAFQ